MAASLRGNPVLAKPTVSVSDGFQIPSILRRQGLRIGSAYAGRALTTAGGAITARGLHLNKTGPDLTRTKWSTLTRAQARNSKSGIRADTRYRPSHGRRSNRFMERRLKPQASRTIPRGTLHVRMGSTMMIAGRTLPLLVGGYLAYTLLPEGVDRTTHEGKLADNVLQNVHLYGNTAAQIYSGAEIAYNVGTAMLAGVSFS